MSKEKKFNYDLFLAGCQSSFGAQMTKSLIEDLYGIEAPTPSPKRPARVVIRNPTALVKSQPVKAPAPLPKPMTFGLPEENLTSAQAHRVHAGKVLLEKSYRQMADARLPEDDCQKMLGEICKAIASGMAPVDIEDQTTTFLALYTAANKMKDRT
ncbi:hypothetical protein ID007_004338 [Salmonella enterica]|nr:hypothetical protein [Salmonella enterica]